MNPESDHQTQVETGLNVKKGFPWRWAVVFVALVVAICILSVTVWTKTQLGAFDQNQKTNQKVVIVEGASPEYVGKRLEERKLIRSAFMFENYIRFTKKEMKIGTYQINPAMTLPEIVDKFTSGKQDTLTITFYPGATIYDNSDIADSKRTDVYTVLRKAGFGDKEVREALNAKYESPLFEDKPDNTTLEGYVYGETYQFDIGVKPKEILEHTFDVYWQRLQKNDLASRLQSHGLNLYQAITLASIVQREVSGSDQKQVAQVFYSRLEKGMNLGSDVTFIYAANQKGVKPTVDIDSPYNTRINPGLTPGPISTPGMEALEAVASPANGDYLYFVAGDDGKTYFSRTVEEHESLVKQHCIKLCSEL